MQLHTIRIGFIALLAALAAFPAAAGPLAIHAGDQLYVTVYGHPELTGPFTVNAADQISLPLAGTVNIHGLGTAQIADRVRLALEPYVIKPAVDVQLKGQPDRIFVSGGPGGVLKFQPGETLSAALADLPVAGQPPAPSDASARGDDRMAALATSRVDLRRVGVVRDGKSLGTFDTSAMSSVGAPGPTLQPGDTIELVDKPVAVHVSGDVRTPGMAHLWTDEALSDALTQVGGVATTAATSHIVLVREGTTQLVALGDPILAMPGKDGDALTVPTAPRVMVAGLVDKPGTITLKTNFTLLSALYAAGGPTNWADLGNVQVIDKEIKATYDVRKLVHGDTSQNPELHDGDVVFVPEGHKVDAKGIFQTILSGLGALWVFHW